MKKIILALSFLSTWVLGNGKKITEKECLNMKYIILTLSG